MASRKLEDLHPEFRRKVERFLDSCAKLYIPVSVVCTYRSPEEQNKLYQRGRDKSGNITDKSKVVTYVRGGNSAHNNQADGKPAALAIDVAFGDRTRLTWKGPWKVLGKVATDYCQMDWGGNWKKFKDSGHFQEQNWREAAKAEPATSSTDLAMDTAEKTYTGQGVTP